MKFIFIGPQTEFSKFLKTLNCYKIENSPFTKIPKYQFDETVIEMQFLEKSKSSFYDFNETDAVIYLSSEEHHNTAYTDHLCHVPNDVLIDFYSEEFDKKPEQFIQDIIRDLLNFSEQTQKNSRKESSLLFFQNKNYREETALHKTAYQVLKVTT